MTRYSSWLVAVACVFLTTGVAGAQEVSGSFEATTVTITPTHVCAYPVRASWDPEQIGITVLLSEGPVDAQAAAAALAPHTHAINQNSLDNKNYITINIWPDGSVAMNATKSEGMVQYIDNLEMQLKADLTTNTADKVAGRVYTEKPVELRDGESYTVDLSFATSITRPPPGEPLGKGGGEPGQALTSLATAARARNWPGMKPWLPEDYFEQVYCYYEDDEPTEAELLECALDDLPNWITDTEQVIEVIDGVDRGGTAILEVKQKQDGFAMLNVVQMRKTQSAWVYERYTMVGMY